MRLKSFYAKSITDAMKMVRDTLGDEAVIVATREQKGGTVHVTAAVEHPDEDLDFNPAPMASTAAGPQYDKPDQDERCNVDEFDFDNDRIAAPAGTQRQELDGDWYSGDLGAEDEEAVIEQLTDVMLRHSVPEDITDNVISCATVIGLEEPGTALVAALEHLFSFKPISKKNDGRTYMLVGPPGAGKTLATAKLAARGVMSSQRIAVISTDTVRAGGTEQLSSLTDVMRIKLQKASDPLALKQCLEAARGADQVYIDTAGLNPFDPHEMKNLAKLLSVGSIEPLLVMPAGIDAAEAGELARVYGTLGVNMMLPTRLDMARRLGSLLSAAHAGSLFFADASNTHKVADGLIKFSPRTLARMLMPEAFSGRMQDNPPANTQGRSKQEKDRRKVNVE